MLRTLRSVFSAPAARRLRRDRSIRLEALEDRKLLATTASANGYKVSVFTRTLSTGDVDILANLSRNGRAIRNNIIVANSTRKELAPAVAINNNGRFVVAYEDVFSSRDSDVKARVFGPNGVALTSAMSADVTSVREFDADVSLNDFGRIAVSYTKVFSSTDLDVRATQFLPSNSAGTSYSTTKIAVSTESNRNEFDSAVKVASNGDFAISYTRRFGSTDTDVKVFVRRTSGVMKRGVNVASSSLNEDSSFISSWTGGTTVRIGFRKSNSTLFSTVSV